MTSVDLSPSLTLHSSSSCYSHHGGRPRILQTTLYTSSSLVNTARVKSPKSRRRRRFHIGHVCGFCRTPRGRPRSTDSAYTFNHEDMSFPKENSPIFKSLHEPAPYSTDDEEGWRIPEVMKTRSDSKSTISKRKGPRRQSNQSNDPTTDTHHATTDIQSIDYNETSALPISRKQVDEIRHSSVDHYNYELDTISSTPSSMVLPHTHSKEIDPIFSHHFASQLKSHRRKENQKCRSLMNLQEVKIYGDDAENFDSCYNRNVEYSGSTVATNLPLSDPTLRCNNHIDSLPTSRRQLSKPKGFIDCTLSSQSLAPQSAELTDNDISSPDPVESVMHGSFSSAVNNDTDTTVLLTSTPISSNSEAYIESHLDVTQFTDDALTLATPTSSSKRSLWGFLLHPQRPSRSLTPVSSHSGNVTPNSVRYSDPSLQPKYGDDKETSANRFFTPRKWKRKSSYNLQSNEVASNRSYRSGKDSAVLSTFPCGNETHGSNSVTSNMRQQTNHPFTNYPDAHGVSHRSLKTSKSKHVSRPHGSTPNYPQMSSVSSSLITQVTPSHQQRPQAGTRLPSIFTHLVHSSQGKEQERTAAALHATSLPTIEGNYGPFLGPQKKDHRGRHTLVLDLDETLVHSSFVEISNYSFIIPVEIDGISHLIYVAKRPGVDKFLHAVSLNYEVVIFTASLAKYADPLMDQLDPFQYCVARLFREQCVFWNGQYVKDMSRMGRELKKIIILDNSPNSYAFQPENAIPIESWFDDPDDNELHQLIPILEALAKVDDIPKAIRNSIID